MSIADKLGFGPKREHTAKADGSVLVSVTPPSFMNLPTQTVKLSADQYNRYLLWRNGQGYIQDMLPELTADQREVLMSGLGPEHFSD